MPTLRTSRPALAAKVAAAGPLQIILVGLPGAGKTTVGRAVAKTLDRSFLDLDVEIERRAGNSIVGIFAAKGEAHFRDLERSVTTELREVSGLVMAPGSGWMTNPGCLELLSPPATVVYLQIDPGNALRRMGLDTGIRPLLRRPDPLAELNRLLAIREPTYLLASHTVRVDFLREEEVVVRVAALAGAPSQG